MCACILDSLKSYRHYTAATKNCIMTKQSSYDKIVIKYAKMLRSVRLLDGGIT